MPRAYSDTGAIGSGSQFLPDRTSIRQLLLTSPPLVVTLSAARSAAPHVAAAAHPASGVVPCTLRPGGTPRLFFAPCDPTSSSIDATSSRVAVPIELFDEPGQRQFPGLRFCGYRACAVSLVERRARRAIACGEELANHIAPPGGCLADVIELLGNRPHQTRSQ
jgi:hypothetical protein